MYTKAVLLAALVAISEARFGQEGLVQSAIQGLSDFGNPGEAATLAGQTPGVLLAGANACDKVRFLLFEGMHYQLIGSTQLSLADEIVATLGDDPAVIAGAAQLVAAEKNFNPFAQDIPTLCSDAGLPATEALRGILPLVDPAVDGAAALNAASAASLQNPVNANGQSIADLVTAAGFDAFTAQAAA
jgi:hypothetical protein